MSERTRKAIVLAAIFLVALSVFSIITNKESKLSTTTMDEASIPVVQFVYNDIVLNELHGYAQEMDMLSMRDGLMPIGDERLLNLEVLSYGDQVENIAYRIRSMDSERLLVEEESADMEATKDKATCSIKLPSIFEENVEYNMEIVVTANGRQAYYYTRIIHSTGCYVDEMLDFALTFHDYTFRDDAADFIPTYMDPATGDPTTLSYVDLTCTLGQITWGKFSGVKLTEPVASFKEINASYNVITLNYVMTNVNERNEVEYFNVEEYYRLRQTPQRIYVLNFERTMNQIFRSENDFLLGKTALQLGIRNRDVEFLANDSGDCIAFVQEGELWCYDRLNNCISQVFSFRGAEGVDNRENWDQHDIKIIRVDEAGSVTFMVYGYMNRGKHEGEVGVGAYYYDAIARTIEEEVFIPTNKSYEVLKAELGQMMYVNEQKMLYIMLSSDIYEINLNDFTCKVKVENAMKNSFAVSKTGRYLAWIDSERINESRSINLEDLKTGMTYKIAAGAGTCMRPLAFIGDDLVCGVANSADIAIDSLGDLVFPISKIQIYNTSEEKRDVIKTYIPQSGKIGTVSVDAHNVYVQLITEKNGRYVESGSDTIMNRETESISGVEITTMVTEVKQTQVALTMKAISDDENVTYIIPKEIVINDDRTVAIHLEDEDYYYVYVKGEVLLATSDASDAIRTANRNYGVVVDANVRYIYKRARNSYQSTFRNLAPNEADKKASSIAKCVSIILTREGVSLGVGDLLEAGQTPLYILQSTLRNATVMEIRDCGIDELLYFIDQNTPVYARVGANKAILLTGYGSTYVTYYDPAKGQNQSVSYDRIEEMFYNGGNYFIAYVK